MAAARSVAFSCAASLAIAAPTGAAQPAPALATPIEPQSLATALNAFAAQTGLQVIYVSQVVAAQRSPGAPSGLPPREVLGRLLEGTGLQFEFLNDRTVRIYSRAARPHARSPPSSGAQPGADAVWLAPLEEVVVNASRRMEPATMAPVSSTVWTEQAMALAGVKGIEEIGALTPGVDFGYNSRLGDYFTGVDIRGVSDMHGTTTTLVLNDTQLLSGRGDTYLRLFPFTFDLDRIEVLRGPQGGRMAQDTLAGALRFSVNEPSLSDFSGQARLEIATTTRGAPSYEAGAAAGGPLVLDRLGFRVSGWHRVDGGYIDRVNPFSGALVEDEANRITRKSARVALAWAPTDSVRVTPALILQSVDGDDVSSFFASLSDPGSGRLKNGYQVAQPWHDEFSLGSLRLTAEAGSLDIWSLTSYYHQTGTATLDQSGIDVFDPTRATANLRQDVFSHESRLSSPDPDARFRGSAGFGYWDRRVHEVSWSDDHREGSESDTVSNYTALAAYGEAAIKITERLTANVGLRLARAEYEAATRVAPTSRVEHRDDYATPDFGLSYQADDRRSIYVTAARGYRAGGIYAPIVGCGNEDGPLPYPADDLWSYELGTKQSGLFDGQVDLDAGVFHIQWSHSEEPPMVGCNEISYLPVNSAVSQGVSIASRLFLSDQLRLGLSLAYTDAHYTETTGPEDAVVIEDGDQLGFPPWTVTASIERDFPLAVAMVSIRADFTYRRSNPGPFQQEHPGSPYYDPNHRPEPSTRMFNLRAVIAWKRLEAALYVANALDSQPVLGLAHACCDDPLYTARTFRPRTAGVSATWRL
ncbi:MAG TPA: TonB-dependent receptor [Steroidobacteraceae bacterium]